MFKLRQDLKSQMLKVLCANTSKQNAENHIYTLKNNIYSLYMGTSLLQLLIVTYFI